MKKAIYLLIISFLCLPLVGRAQVGDLNAKLQQLRVQLQAVGGRSLVPVTNPVSRPTVSAVAITRNLSLGSQGEDVRSLQEILKTKGFFKENSTGYYGPATVEAVRAWQLAEKIITKPENGGVVGPLTIKHLSLSSTASAGGVVRTAPGSLRFWVTYPQTGQTFNKGGRMSLSWAMAKPLLVPIVDQVAGERQTEVTAFSDIPSVDVILTPAGGQPFRLVSDLPNRGFYAFTLPEMLSPGSYTAKIVAHNGTLSALSNQFIIK